MGAFSLLVSLFGKRAGSVSGIVISWPTQDVSLATAASIGEGGVRRQARPTGNWLGAVRGEVLCRQSSASRPWPGPARKARWRSRCLRRAARVPDRKNASDQGGLVGGYGQGYGSGPITVEGRIGQTAVADMRPCSTAPARSSASSANARMLF